MQLLSFKPARLHMTYFISLELQFNMRGKKTAVIAIIAATTEDHKRYKVSSA